MQLVDIHTHNGVWEHTAPEKYDYLGETMDDFVADLDADRVSHCFMSSVTALLGDVVEGNKVTFRDAALDPRLYAAVYYNPVQKEASLNEIERYRDNPKFVAFKTRPEYHGMGLNDPAYAPLIQMADALQKPILVHTFSMGETLALWAVARRTSATIVMIHAGGADWEESVPLVRPYDNVIIEPVTSKNYPGKVRFIVDQVGHERVVFGSDYGLISRARVLETFRDANLLSDEYDAIFRTNALRIFGLKER